MEDAVSPQPIEPVEVLAAPTARDRLESLLTRLLREIDVNATVGLMLRADKMPTLVRGMLENILVGKDLQGEFEKAALAFAGGLEEEQARWILDGR